MSSLKLIIKNMIKVKICGITNLDDGLSVSSCGADAIGFIFTKKSPRYISKNSAKKIISKLDPFIVKVGVFLDQEKEEVLDLAAYLKLDVLQFHGKESVSYCKFFKSKYKVIKVFFPEDEKAVDSIRRYDADAFLFDLRHEEKIKGKKSLSSKAVKVILKFIKSNKRVIISGGLNLGNINKIKKLLPYAVDVSSGVEKFVGKKDSSLIKQFIKKVKNENS